MKIFQKFKSSARSLGEALKKALRSGDPFLFGGLALMGYGLHLYQPWIAFTVCGACLMALGLLMGDGG